MMARGRDVLLKPLLGSAFGVVSVRNIHQQTHTAPCFVFIKTVERMTRADTCLAAAALVEIYFESILLAGSGWSDWQQITVKSPARLLGFMRAREFLNRSQFLLLREQVVNQRARRSIEIIRNAPGWR